MTTTRKNMRRPPPMLETQSYADILSTLDTKSAPDALAFIDDHYDNLMRSGLPPESIGKAITDTLLRTIDSNADEVNKAVIERLTYTLMNDVKDGVYQNFGADKLAKKVLEDISKRIGASEAPEKTNELLNESPFLSCVVAFLDDDPESPLSKAFEEEKQVLKLEKQKENDPSDFNRAAYSGDEISVEYIPKVIDEALESGNFNKIKKLNWDRRLISSSHDNGALFTALVDHLNQRYREAAAAGDVIQQEKVGLLVDFFDSCHAGFFQDTKLQDIEANGDYDLDGLQGRPLNQPFSIKEYEGRLQARFDDLDPKEGTQPKPRSQGFTP